MYAVVEPNDDGPKDAVKVVGPGVHHWFKPIDAGLIAACLNVAYVAGQRAMLQEIREGLPSQVSPTEAAALTG